MRTNRRQTFVFIHGAWHGGWCWRYVQNRLEARGYPVVAPTLTGLGNRTHLISADTGLDTHIQDIIGVIRYAELSDIVLVGHSYGGMVVTGIADILRDRIRHCVFLDAALPKDGQSMLTQGPDLSPAEFAENERNVRALSPDGIGLSPFPPETVGVPKHDPHYDWVARNMTPHPLKAWFDPISIRNGGLDDLPRTYIHCVKPVLPNASFSYHAEQVKADKSWVYYELKTGHDAMVTAPKELADTLVRSAN